MELFKKCKKAPIKLKGFDFIGPHSDYEYCCYYVKELGSDNFELAEVILEGHRRHFSLGVGTKVQMIDTFMSNYLDNATSTIEDAVNNSFKDLEEASKKDLILEYSKEIPSQIKNNRIFKEALENNYKVLYCKNTENERTHFGVVTIMLVRDDIIESNNKYMEIKRKYTLFKPLRCMVTPGFIKGESKIKYHIEELPVIVINHDILNK